MPQFSGTLKRNEIYSTIVNMLISLDVLTDDVEGITTDIVDEARVDGGLYGDTKVYYATDANRTTPWLADDESTNLLANHRAIPPKTQAITLDIFRQICLTTDEVLSKRAWGDEYTFSNFNGRLVSWMRDTKKIYDYTLYGTFIGTTTGVSAKSNIEIPLNALETEGGLSGEALARMRSQTIANELANLLVDLKRPTRDYNDYGFVRSYPSSKVKFIWNSKFVNEITNLDLPTIFHNEELKKHFTKYVLPKEYFGTPKAEATLKEDNGGTLRSLIEADYATGVGAIATHVFPGDVIPAGTAKVLAGEHINKGENQGRVRATELSTGIEANEAYTVDEDVICKVVVKLPPYMSAFEIGTSFYNGKSLTTNRYLTFGHNKLQYLEAYPFITVHAD